MEIDNLKVPDATESGQVSRQTSVEETHQEYLNNCGNPCWNELDFSKSEYLTNSTENVMTTIKKTIEIMKYYDKKVKENHADIIEFMTKLYALHIKDKLNTKSLEETKQLISSFPFLTVDNGEVWTESINLYKAAKELSTLSLESARLYGLIEIEQCILKIHKIAVPKFGGSFSVKERFGIHGGVKYNYHKIHKEEDAREQLQSLIDLYNPFIRPIKEMWKENPEKAVETLLKLSTYFLYKFLYLHPFGEGNGRIARLLTSYAMSIFNPFMTPVYKIFSSATREDYLDALVRAQAKINPDPGQLVEIMVHTNYSTWKNFHDAVELKENGSDWQQLLIASARKSEEDILK